MNWINFKVKSRFYSFFRIRKKNLFGKFLFEFLRLYTFRFDGGFVVQFKVRQRRIGERKFLKAETSFGQKIGKNFRVDIWQDEARCFVLTVDRIGQKNGSDERAERSLKKRLIIN